MANKINFPERAGAGSTLHPTKTAGVPFFRTPRLRIGSAAGGGGTSAPAPTIGQIWPRKN